MRATRSPNEHTTSQDATTPHGSQEESNTALHLRSMVGLPRLLSPLETWGFGFTGLLLWLLVAPTIHASLGMQAIFMWAPIAIAGTLFTLQVKRLAAQWPDMAGGTPNYITRLLQNYPWLGRYAALAYLQGWTSVPPLTAMIFADLIATNLEPLGLSVPVTPLRITFTAVVFLLAFSGIRALSILHLVFIIPAFGFLLVFIGHGLGWITFSPTSTGVSLPAWPKLSFGGWVAAYFVSVYAAFGVDTASSFMADSQRPSATVKCFSVAAWLILPVYVGGSLVLHLLTGTAGDPDSPYLDLLIAATPFWGGVAPFLVTFLIAAACFLSAATAVGNSPRIVYQLARDGHLSPVFGVVSRRTVLTPALILVLVNSIIFLVWDYDSALIISATGYFFSIAVLHLGIWLNRGQPEARWPWLSLAIFLGEVVIFIVGGVALGVNDLLLGLLFPTVILAGDAGLRRLPLAVFQPAWWSERYRPHRQGGIVESEGFQVAILIILLCAAASAGWATSFLTSRYNADILGLNLFAILLLIAAFVGIATAAWTSIRQFAVVSEARTEIEDLLTTALDGILVIDELGVIRQANRAAEQVFALEGRHLVGHRLNDLLPGLDGEPHQWVGQSEHEFATPNRDTMTVELAITPRRDTTRRDYTVTLRDITERRQAEEARLMLIQEQVARAQAEEEIVVRDEFLSIAAHELKTPLTTLLGHTQAIQRRTAREQTLNERDQRSLRVINEQALRLNKHIATLLDLSRIELGQFSLDCQPLDVYALVRRVVAEWEPTLDRHTIILNGAEESLIVQGDELRLEQVFQNLVGNAIKYSPNGGPITLRAEQRDGHCWISIRDQGIGIPEGALPHLFQRFYRATNVDARNISGFGIGLYLVNEIVTRHGGRIEVTSTEGTGSTFVICLPLSVDLG